MVQFVPLKVETSGEPWQKWASKYRPEGNGIPIIYVIRADGTMLYGKAGSMDGPALRQFMMQYLAQSGRLLTDAETTLLTEALDKAKKAQSENDTAGAIEAIGAAKKVGPLGKLGSYAKVAVEADAFATKLEADGKARIAEAQAKLSGGDASLEDALALVEARRMYGAFPDLKTELIGVFRELKKGETGRRDIEQAESLDRAKGYLGLPGGQSRAVSALQRIVTRYPESAVAELAKAELEKLPAEAVASRPSTSSETPPSDSRPSTALSRAAVRKKAASNLRMARVFAGSRPEKARKYAEEVIELLPNSDEAAEAKALLRQLE